MTKSHIIDLYSELTKRSEEYTSLYHYTKFAALNEMLKNHSLLLRRIDLVNDKYENERISSLWNGKIFVSCFTHQKNDTLFFKDYGDICIQFKNPCVDNNSQVFFDSELIMPLKNFNKDLNFHSDVNLKDYRRDYWCIYNISKADVFYKDESIEFVADDGLESNAGLIKNKKGFDRDGKAACWENEAETRIRVSVRPIALESQDAKTYIKPGDDLKQLFIKLPTIEKVFVKPSLAIKEKEKIINLCNEHSISVC